MGVDETSVKSTYDTLMESMNIAHLSQRSIDHLSGGERQKIAFARAIIKKPSLILADEPTGNLDWASTKAIADTMIQSHHDGNTNVVITHDLLFAKYITQSCDARLVSLPTLDQNLQPASHYTRSALVGSSLIHSHS
jgi:putative ABC transport system ATP-binding protein